MGHHLDLPPIHHDGCRPADFTQDLVDGLAFVASSPSKAARQIVARPQWNDSDGRMIGKLDFVYVDLTMFLFFHFWLLT